jgi:crossover junction endodeoxyribonuclease RuvC
VTITIGIDLGLTGAIARLGFRDPVVADLPITEDRGDKVVDVRALRALLRQLVPAYDGQALVVIEDVRIRAMPGRPMSHSNEGKLMRTRGHVEALVWLLGWKLEVVQPASWKREFGLLRKGEEVDKDVARLKAVELFPGLADQLQRKLDHNRADALCLARYGQLRFA